VNGGYTEEEQLFNVVIEGKKRKDLDFQKMEEVHSHNIVMKEEG